MSQSETDESCFLFLFSAPRLLVVVEFLVLRVVNATPERPDFPKSSEASSLHLLNNPGENSSQAGRHS